MSNDGSTPISNIYHDMPVSDGHTPRPHHHDKCLHRTTHLIVTNYQNCHHHEKIHFSRDLRHHHHHRYCNIHMLAHRVCHDGLHVMTQRFQAAYVFQEPKFKVGDLVRWSSNQTPNGGFICIVIHARDPGHNVIRYDGSRSYTPEGKSIKGSACYVLFSLEDMKFYRVSYEYSDWITLINSFSL